jgi:Uma2 family endonuclease
MRPPEETVRYTYEDYLTWDGPERYELIEGIAYLQETPTTQHQIVLGQLHGLFWDYLRHFHKECIALFVPYDLRFDLNQKYCTVVQPDMAVLRVESLEPILLIEVLSPSTAKKDKDLKLDIYKRNGILEYWVVDPEEETIADYAFSSHLEEIICYCPNKGEQRISPQIFPELSIALKDVFGPKNGIGFEWQTEQPD